MTIMDDIVSYIPVGDLPEHLDPDAVDAVQAIGERVGACRDLDEAMDLVWDLTTDVMPHDRIGLAFVEDDGLTITARYHRVSYENMKLNEGYRCILSRSSLKEVASRGCARIIRDIAEYHRLKPESVSAKLLLSEGVRSNLTIPLLVDDRKVGFFFFSSREVNAFDHMHASVLLAIESRLSQAIEKAWMIKRLADANERYLEMLGFISHEMKSPLASLITRGETYLGGYLGETDELAEQTIRSMVETGGYMINMVNNYLDFSRLENGDMKFNSQEGVDFMKDVLQFAVDTVSVRAGQRGSRISVDSKDELSTIKADPDLLRIVMINLIDNAIKYGYDNIEVKLSVAVESGYLVVKVRNRGFGFDEEQKKKLFKRFSRLRQKGSENRRGTGLGLYLTWWIVQQHRGRIIAAGEPGEWAEFELRLPVE